MTTPLDETHDPARKSWLASANQAGTDFPLQNLPFGLYRAAAGSARPCVAIGDQMLDIKAALDTGALTGGAADAAHLACTGDTLNALINAGQEAAAALRGGVFHLLAQGAQEAAHLLVAQDEARMLLPAAIGGYTDFFCSIHHAERMGRVLRPDNPLAANFKYLPVAYNGRASSIAVSGTDLARPHGQRGVSGGGATFGPSSAMDYELELAAFLQGGNARGTPIGMDDAARQVFGYALLNDWSARDMQRWESLPLGPFLGKSMLTSLSPWIVTEAAMAPFRCPATIRAEGDPPPFPHLDSPLNRAAGGLDLTMEAWIHTPAARAGGREPHLLSRTKFDAMYWTFAQMVAHHASNGCNLRAGDIIGSGTASDATDLGRGCLAEIQMDGPVSLPGGEQRRFLEDGDDIILTAHARRDGFVPIGFGACRGRILPALDFPAACQG